MLRKDKPVLYELLDKDKLSTPEWFYDKKKKKAKVSEAEKAETSDKKEDVIAEPAKKPLSRPESNMFAKEQAKIAPEVAKSPENDKKRVDNDRIVPDWVAKKPRQALLPVWWMYPLAGLAIILVCLLIYRFIFVSDGPSGVVDDNKVAANSDNGQTASVNPKLKQISEGPVSNNLIFKDETPKVDNTTNQQKRADYIPVMPVDKKPVVKIPKPVVPDRPIVPVIREGQCLILCGSDKKVILEPVQTFFNMNGMPVRIEKFHGRYVVVTEQTFAKTSLPEAANYKKKLAEVGQQYDKNRPKGTPGFSSAFKSMYWVNVKNIK